VCFPSPEERLLSAKLRKGQLYDATRLISGVGLKTQSPHSYRRRRIDGTNNANACGKKYNRVGLGTKHAGNKYLGGRGYVKSPPASPNLVPNLQRSTSTSAQRLYQQNRSGLRVSASAAVCPQTGKRNRRCQRPRRKVSSRVDSRETAPVGPNRP